jgi:hypothetical protein
MNSKPLLIIGHSVLIGMLLSNSALAQDPHALLQEADRFAFLYNWTKLDRFTSKQRNCSPKGVILEMCSIRDSEPSRRKWIPGPCQSFPFTSDESC